MTPFKPPANPTIAIIGLGYVGLPLAVEFGKKHKTIGFDISQKRIDELNRARDRTLEVTAEELKQARHLRFTHNPEDIATASVFIITVPTPIDAHKRPDLGPVKAAAATVGRQLTTGDVVILESTVYPGCTEEVVVPILERESGLAYNQGFFAGYSPERINPGDKQHRLPNILKVTSGSTPEVADFVDGLYAGIITAGTHKAGSIAVAEAAKVIENTQRDVNIALINELAMLFNKLGLDTEEVLQAAGTKWNFLPFRPGLVGGHCIGVDPYYLTHKAVEAGFHPEMILAGRRVNDGMGQHVVDRVAREMTARRIHVVDSRVLVLGLAFKENCPDLRNTRVIDIVRGLEALHAKVDVHDPWVDAREAKEEYGLELVEQPEQGAYDAIILAVPHRQFKEMSAEDIRKWGKSTHVLYDVKYLFSRKDTDARL
jgi:UDP-N-acetyl-D-galactosamine dehydrogenase